MTMLEQLTTTLRAGLDPNALIRVRRPNALFQVNLPAFLADGDAVNVFLRPAQGDRVLVTDLGSTLMRMSYTGPTKDHVVFDVARLAEANGLSLLAGELQVEVGLSELLPACLGLLQVQTQAESFVAASRQRDRLTQEFKQLVVEFVREIFGADSVQAGYHDAKIDPHGVSTIDALVSSSRPLAIAAVPNELAAERAIGTRFMMQGALDARTRWIAIPRDLQRLSHRAQTRLLKTYNVAASSFLADRDAVREKLADLAA